MKRYSLHRDVSAYKQVIDYEKELNEEQLNVVTAEPGPILVIAGAGSGKTRVVTYRVARLLEKGANPSSILLLTFTNKAASVIWFCARTLAESAIMATLPSLIMRMRKA
jgi:DNA helicase-2/ATP-dependent DNA helicase PcrA